MGRHFELPKVAHPDFSSPDRKPIGPVEVDWSNPMTRGLQFATISQGPDIKDLVSHRVIKPTTALTTPVIVEGKTAVQYGTTGYYTAPFNGWTQEATIAGTVKLDVTNPDAYAGGLVDTTDGSWVSLQGQFNEEVRAISAGTGFGTGISSPDGSATIGELKRCAGIVSVKDNYTAVMLEQQHYSTSGTGSSGNKAWDTLYIGARNSGSVLAADDAVVQEYFYAWNRALSETELAQLHRNPYQILKPAVPLSTYVPAAAATRHFELPKIAHPDFAIPGRQPVGPVEIDWENPITEGLISFVMLNKHKPVDLVRGVLPVMNQHDPLPDIKNGEAVNFFDGTNDGYNYGQGMGNLISGRDQTIIARAAFDNNFAQQQCLASNMQNGETSPTNGGGGIYCTTDKKVRYFYEYGSGSNVVVDSGVQTINNDQFYTFGATRHVGATTRVELYLDGVDVGGSASETNPAGSEDTEWHLGYEIQSGGSGGGGAFTQELDGWLSYAMLFIVAKTPEEMRSLYENPWQILKPAVPLSTYFPAAGGYPMPLHHHYQVNIGSQ